MNHSRNFTHTARLGRWLPSDSKRLHEWLKKIIEEAEQKKAPFHPVVEEFRRLIENDPGLACFLLRLEYVRKWLAMPGGCDPIGTPPLLTTCIVGC